MLWVKSTIAVIIAIGAFVFLVWLCLKGFNTQQKIKDKAREFVEQTKEVPEQIKEQYLSKDK